MRTRDDIFYEVLVRNAIGTSDTFVTDTTLKNWFRDAHLWAASFHKWPMTEGRVSTTFATSEEWQFEGYKADAIRMLLIGGSRLTKLNFEDYQTFREEEPIGSDRVFTTFGKLVFVNPYCGLTGTMVAYGQYQPFIDVTDETGLTIFTDWNDEGNEAIFEKMSSYLKRRMGNMSASLTHEEAAKNKLNEAWNHYMQEQNRKQTHPDSGGMFKRIDVLVGTSGDNVSSENQF